MITIDYSNAILKTKLDKGSTYVFDVIRKKWVLLTPEEHVRQCFLYYLIHTLQYPPSLIAVEKKIQLGKSPKRFDMVVYSPSLQPWMLVECKEPKVPLTQETLFQLLNYQRVIQSRYWVITNGHETYCADAHEVHAVTWMKHLPAYNG